MENQEVLYARWLSGEISDQELKEQAGEEALADVKRIVGEVDQWSMPTYDTTVGYEKLKRDKNLSGSGKVRNTVTWVILGLVGLFLLTFFMVKILSGSAEHEIFASNGETIAGVLPDGSVVVLNDGSAVSYTSEDWADTRALELKGEAYFDVTKGSQFVVQTTQGSVRVLGTQFNVKAWQDDIYVECYEGRVQVSMNGQDAILAAGESVSTRDGVMTAKLSISYDKPAWQNAESRFVSEDLREVFDEIERQYDVTVESNVARREFSGSFTHDDLEQALISICKPLGLTYRIEDDNSIIITE